MDPGPPDGPPVHSFKIMRRCRLAKDGQVLWRMGMCATASERKQQQGCECELRETSSPKGAYRTRALLRCSDKRNSSFVVSNRSQQAARGGVHMPVAEVRQDP
jgi:hypothetical protein